MNSRYYFSNDIVKYGYSNYVYDELMFIGKEFLFYENFKFNFNRLDCSGFYF